MLTEENLDAGEDLVEPGAELSLVAGAVLEDPDDHAAVVVGLRTSGRLLGFEEVECRLASLRTKTLSSSTDLDCRREPSLTA